MGEIYFSFDNILDIVWISAGVVAVSMLWLLTAYRRRVLLCGGSDVAADTVPEGVLPPVSVVVYASDNPLALSHLLHQLLEQDYPAPTEVIVVNDGSVEEVADVVNRLAVSHRNLYHTYVPDEAHNLSRKKLGVSLGIKAARHPFVVHVCAECVVASTQWLRGMASPFAHGKEVVLGFAAVKGVKRVSDRVDEAVEGVKWLSAALKGKPYRGTGYNLAYSRKVFFDAKGFSRSLTLHYGDDDLFVNQIANGTNTAVVLGEGCVLSVESPDPDKTLRELRMRHSFTARFLPKGASRFFGVSAVAMWLWLAGVVVGTVFSLPNALPAILFVLTVPALWIPLALAWHRAASRLGIELKPWRMPVALMCRWMRTLRYKLGCGRAARRNYTWLQR